MLAEVFAHAASDKSCRQLLFANALPFLKEKVRSSRPGIMIRAAVALAKTANVVTEKRSEVLEDDIVNIIISACVNASLSTAVRTWAVEGLAFLSVHPEIKARIAKNEALLKALCALASAEDKSLCYGVTSILANLTSYRPRLTEEQQQLLKIKEMSGEAVPKVHLLLL